MATDRVIVVGAGLTAAKAAETLRREGFAGEIAIVGQERHLPYERPPLSKTYLRGDGDLDEVFPLDRQWYLSNGVELWVRATATSIDAAGHTVSLHDGRDLRYDKLLLATGSRPRVPDLPGADAAAVHYLRTLEDSDRLAAGLRAVHSAGAGGAGHLIVVGDGWIGMEVAASARTLGVEVTVIGLGAHPLERVLGPELGAFFGRVHTDHGVRLRPRAQVRAITTPGPHAAPGTPATVELATGETIPGDRILVAIGAVPQTGPAEAAGLTMDPGTGGVLVSRMLRTSNPDIFAAGDIASVPSVRYARTLRVEHWATALHQGPHAARSILGSDAPFDQLPYFYTDQYDVSMEYLGNVAGPAGYDDLTISGSVDAGEFVAFWLRGGRVEAGMAVNVWEQMDRIDALIRRDGPVPRAELTGFLSG